MKAAVLFHPINETVVAKNKIQIWAVKHACTLIFLSFIGVIAWLTLLTLAILKYHA